MAGVNEAEHIHNENYDPVQKVLFIKESITP